MAIMSGAPLDPDPETASHHGGIADLAASALGAIMSGDTPTPGELGCGSTACIFDAPSVGVPYPCACLDETPSATRIRVRKATYRRRAEVDRLRAEVEQLKYEQDYTPPTGAVSEGLRACVKAAGQACLDGEADCTKAGCVVGHQAGEILDAYDDAAADVERLTAKLDAEVAVVDRTRTALGGKWGEVDGLARILVDEAARLADMLAVSEARLTECQGLLASERESSTSIAAGFEQVAAKLDAHEALAEVQIARLTAERDGETAEADEQAAEADSLGELYKGAIRQLATKNAEAARLAEERDALMREVCVWHGRDIVGQRFPGPVLGMQGARKAAAARGWGHLYPEDSTTHEPGNADYIAWCDAGMPPPAPGHGEPACSRCKGAGVTRSVSVDMSGEPGPPSRCPCTVEPGGEQ